jgi:hypothetical protein
VSAWSYCAQAGISLIRPTYAALAGLFSKEHLWAGMRAMPADPGYPGQATRRLGRHIGSPAGQAEGFPGWAEFSSSSPGRHSGHWAEGAAPKPGYKSWAGIPGAGPGAGVKPAGSVARPGHRGRLSLDRPRRYRHQALPTFPATREAKIDTTLDPFQRSTTTRPHGYSALVPETRQEDKTRGDHY